MVAEEGVLSLNKGLVATILREVPCYAGQFGAYTVTKRLWAKHVDRVPESQVGLLGCFVAGGVGGLACWIVQYP